jgi:hypothetical protein
MLPTWPQLEDRGVTHHEGKKSTFWIPHAIFNTSKTCRCTQCWPQATAAIYPQVRVHQYQQHCCSPTLLLQTVNDSICLWSGKPVYIKRALFYFFPLPTLASCPSVTPTPADMHEKTHCTSYSLISPAIYSSPQHLASDIISRTSLYNP